MDNNKQQMLPWKCKLLNPSLNFINLKIGISNCISLLYTTYQWVFAGHQQLADSELRQYQLETLVQTNVVAH